MPSLTIKVQCGYLLWDVLVGAQPSRVWVKLHTPPPRASLISVNGRDRGRISTLTYGGRRILNTLLSEHSTLGAAEKSRHRPFQFKESCENATETGSALPLLQNVPS